MDDRIQFYNFTKKLYERLTFLFKHYIPNGKQPIESDRDLLYELYKVFDNGILDIPSGDSVDKELCSQLDLFPKTSQSVSKNGEAQ